MLFSTSVKCGFRVFKDVIWPINQVANPVINTLSTLIANKNYSYWQQGK